jgi:hypothetical protein
VTHVATHPRLIQAPRGRRWLEDAQRRWIDRPGSRLRLVATAGDDRLYELLARAPAEPTLGSQP